MNTNENLSPTTVTRLVRELKNVESKPVEGIKVTFNESNVGDIQAEIAGPQGTPYEGGLFRLKLVVPSDFPSTPPKGFFLTKIFHPNISKTGEICVNTLKRDWKPELSLTHILTVIRCLLIEPYPESALNEEAGKLLLEDYSEYARKAKLMTSIHAMKRTTSMTGEHPRDDQQAGSEKKKTEENSETISSPKQGKAEKRKVLEKKRSLRRL